MNKFLASLEITFRRDPTNFRPRVNKLNSVKDKEQKGLSFYVSLRAPSDEPFVFQSRAITSSSKSKFHCLTLTSNVRRMTCIWNTLPTSDLWAWFPMS